MISSPFANEMPSRGRPRRSPLDLPGTESQRDSEGNRGTENLPRNDSGYGRSGAHGGSDGVNALRSGGAGAEADSRKRMGGRNCGGAEHGESLREERAGGAHGAVGRVYKVGGTERQESRGGDSEREDSRDFGNGAVRLLPYEELKTLWTRGSAKRHNSSVWNVTGRTMLGDSGTGSSDLGEVKER